MFSLYWPVISLLSLRARRYSTRIRFLNHAATYTKIGIIAATIRVSFQLMVSMNVNAVRILTSAQVTSSKPQETNSAIRWVSEVRRDIIQPTGVRSKYENDRRCKWLKMRARKSYCTRWPRMPVKAIKQNTPKA